MTKSEEHQPLSGLRLLPWEGGSQPKEVDWLDCSFINCGPGMGWQYLNVGVILKNATEAFPTAI